MREKEKIQKEQSFNLGIFISSNKISGFDEKYAALSQLPHIHEVTFTQHAENVGKILNT
jgi:hypothetical protein